MTKHRRPITLIRDCQDHSCDPRAGYQRMHQTVTLAMHAIRREKCRGGIGNSSLSRHKSDLAGSPGTHQSIALKFIATRNAG